MPTALVRRPGPRLADGIVTHIDRSPIDLDLAIEQWTAYCAALAAAGWDVVEVEPADDCPDAVFIEDAVVVHGDLAVITRPGALERRGETAGAERAVRDLGLRVVRIEEPGTLDGGDVLRAGDTAYVGLGGRTNGIGIQQLATHLKEFGVRVQAVPGHPRPAPEVGRHGAARRHRHRLGAGRRRQGGVPRLRGRARGGWCPRHRRR
jgi:dimethylargininase